MSQEKKEAELSFGIAGFAGGLRYQSKPDIQGFIEIPALSLQLYL